MQSLTDKMKKLLGEDNYDKFVTFWEKNKRYVAAVVLLVIVVVILAKFVNTSGNKKDGDTEATEADVSATFELDSEFEENSNEELTTLISNYLTAYAADDLDTLTKLAVPMSDNEKSYIGVFSQYIEAYQNVKCYSKAGLSKGSYLVSVSYDLKFYGVDTVAPGLEFYYVETNDDGELYINNLYSSYNLGRGENELDTNVYSVILKYEQQDDVVALQKQVEDAYNAAVAGDANLATMLTSTIPTAMSQWVSTLDTEDTQDTDAGTEQTTEQTTEQGTEQQPEQNSESTEQQPEQQQETPQATAVQVIATDVSVRETPSVDGGFVAKANQGETYTRLGTDGDWTQIDYNGTPAYIKTEFVQDVTN